MNLFRALKFGAKPRAASDDPARVMLPHVNAFVDVRVDERTERHSIPVDDISADVLTTRALPGLRVGSVADFLYTNPTGRFRFSTVCIGLDERQARFKTPQTVKTLTNFGTKRSAVRLESLVAVGWRYAPGGVGNGDFAKGSLTDLSRNGASLVIARHLKTGTQVEVRIALKPAAPALVIVCQVMRAGKIESSGKSFAGLRFLNVDAAGESAIDDFIHERQADRRDRGVV